VLAQRLGEAVTRPLRRRAADDSTQPVVFSDQASDTAPRGQRVDALRHRHADHAADRVAGATRPAERFQLCDQPATSGSRALLPTAPPRTRWYLLNVHGANPFVVQTPATPIARGQPSRVLSYLLENLPVGSTESPVRAGENGLLPTLELPSPFALSAHSRTLLTLQWTGRIERPPSGFRVRGHTSRPRCECRTLTAFERSGSCVFLAPCAASRCDLRIGSLTSGLLRSRD